VVTALASNIDIKQIGPSSHDGGPNVCVGDFSGVDIVVCEQIFHLFDIVLIKIINDIFEVLFESFIK
jgi:hypothetical protein